MSEEGGEGLEQKHKHLQLAHCLRTRQKIKEDSVKDVFFHKPSSILLSDCPNGQLAVN